MPDKGPERKLPSYALHCERVSCRITVCDRHAACWKAGLCFDGQEKLELKRAVPCNIMQEARHMEQRDMEATLPHLITRPEKNLNNLDFFVILQSR